MPAWSVIFVSSATDCTRTFVATAIFPQLTRLPGKWKLRPSCRLVRPKPAVTARIADYIVRTARNRALPSATRS
jgi:hypothetical protein